MKKTFLIFSTGFALFSMFFGSGNLVFPITVGQESGGHYLAATFGILATGVLVPFLGVFGMLLYKGESDSYFGCFGKIGVFLFSLFALSLMGPFGVLARCLTVAHGALELLIPSLPLAGTSIALCTIIYLLTVNKNRIVSVVGPLLTPILLLSIGAIAFLGLKNGLNSETTSVDAFAALKHGFLQGYQTMDLLAAFFFSTFILNHLQKIGTAGKEGEFSSSVFAKSALVGAALLSAVYSVLVMLGWVYAPLLEGVKPQEMLGTIALEVLGPFAAPCVSAAVVLACLTTAIVLSVLFADFIRREVCKEKIGNKTALLATLTIGFLVSTLDFNGIAAFIGPILEAVYPALIVLTVVNIAHKMWGFAATHWPATAAFVTKLWWS